MNSATGGEVLYKIKSDTKDFDKGINDVKKSLSVKDLVKADLISSAIKGIAGQIYGVTKSIMGIGTSVVKLAATGGMDRALNIEQARFKLQGLGHDANETQQIMDNALAAVKGTAYGLDEAATVAASAVAAGVKPGQDLERTLKLVGDAATISGRDMNSMGAIFNKIAANGKITGEELNQLADSGIPILQLLAQTMGKSTEEVRELVSAGKVGFAEFQNAIEQGMGGAALTMGQTFNGALANMKAALSRLGETVATPLMQSLTPIMATLTGLIDAIGSGSQAEIQKNINLLSKQIPKMIENVIKAIEPILKTVLPVIQQLFPMIVEIIASNLPPLLTQLTGMLLSMLPMLIQGLTQMIVGLINALPGILTQLAGMLPIIITSLVNALVQIAQALAQQLPTIIPIVVKAIINGLLTLLDNIDVLIDAGIQLIMALADGLIAALPIIIEKAPQIIEKLVTNLIANGPKIIAAGIKLIVKLGEGLIRAVPQLLGKIPQIINGIVNGLKSGVSQVANVGKNIMKGLWNGITGLKDWVINKVKGLGKSILKGLKNVLGIHSPSTEFAIIGKYSVLGYTEEIDKMSKFINDKVAQAFGLDPQLTNSMSNNFSPTVNTTVNVNQTQDPLGRMVNDVKTFSGGSRQDYNYGLGG